MGIIREPLNVDFVVDPRPLTKEEEKAISDFIKAHKKKQNSKKNNAGKSTKLKPKQPIS